MGIKILNNKDKANTCDMCKRIITCDLAFYKIKRRFVFQDYDGWWHGKGLVIICQDCINKIKEGLSHDENKRIEDIKDRESVFYTL